MSETVRFCTFCSGIAWKRILAAKITHSTQDRKIFTCSSFHNFSFQRFLSLMLPEKWLWHVYQMFCWHLLLFCKWLVVTCPDLTTLETQLDAFSAVMTPLNLWVHLPCVQKAEPAVAFKRVHGHGAGDLVSREDRPRVSSIKLSVFVLMGFHPCVVLWVKLQEN